MTKKYPNFSQELVNFVSMLEILKKIEEKPDDSLLPDSCKVIEEHVKHSARIVAYAAMEQFRETVYEAAEDYMKSLRASSETNGAARKASFTKPHKFYN